MSEQLEQAEIQVIADEIRDTLKAAFDVLIEQRDRAYANAIASVEGEAESLAQESACIEASAENLSELLPAMARTAQAEHDRLLLAGDREGAAAKLVEQKEAEAGPGRMRARQATIADRLKVIESEKKAVARRVFEAWYIELQHLIRPAESALFIELLDSGLDAMRAFQERHGLTGTLDRPYDFLVTDKRIEDLTADERSPEWISGNHWYGGRTR
jgi:hypothetical protein